MKKIYQLQLQQKKSVIDTKVMDNDLLLSSDKSVIVSNMIEYIKNNYSKKIVMYDLVSELQCSATLLNSKFKSETGTTFNDYLNRYRILMAVQMIKEHTLPLYRIAEETGFKNYKYFNIVFNKYIGCSPKDFENAVL